MLPEWVVVKGYPRTLELDETAGMTSLGSFAASDQTLTVKFSHLAPSTPPLEEASFLDEYSDHHQASAGGGTTMRLSPARPASYVRNLGRKTTEQGRSVPGSSGSGGGGAAKGDGSERRRSTQALDAALANLRTNLQRRHGEESGRHKQQPEDKDGMQRPEEEVEEEEDERSVCAYWCKTGQCKFEPRCRYRHEMPLTAAGLAQVNLYKVPRWWLVKTLGTLPDAVAASDGQTVTKGKAESLRKMKKLEHLGVRRLNWDAEKTTVTHRPGSEEADKEQEGIDQDMPETEEGLAQAQPENEEPRRDSVTLVDF